MLNYFLNIGLKLASVYTHAEAWALAIFAYIVSYLGDASAFAHYIGIAVFVDLVLGIWRSRRKAKTGVRSKGIRATISKAFVYYLLLFLIIQIDKITDAESLLITRGFCALMIGAEIWSIMANLAVIFPEVGALRLVQKYLITEIADKTRIDEETIKTELNKIENEGNNNGGGVRSDSERVNRDSKEDAENGES